ncbi:type 1 glutamine amidotransferase [Mucilaginibacter sp. E4BP6]|uniref:type 1 glutamine amidotransferase n=1 Tax=Mucilaginibacter sp. E4BP6 TaxID=2723089 RepID=UPI0015C7B860|nr:GMP synthase [Mucilaginibacter sp. E4BP6]NYE64271.1 GMP synthase-like glutamine amidotransferase [Mucilaginibacter sp. E4BP6]
MTQTDKPPIKVAILDLYNGIENEGIRGFKEILERYKTKNMLDLTYELFDVRKNCEVPGLEFDVYLSSGGPGSPLDSEGSEWEKKYFNLITQLEQHNQSDDPQKKYVFFVCHSFQLMCRRYQLGYINQRISTSFGILPVHQTSAGKKDLIFKDMDDPFYAVDSRSWQVINPNEKQFTDLGMQLLAIEKKRPHVDLPRAMMAIRFSEYFVGTQFHPEADPEGMRTHLLNPDRKKEVIYEHGNDKYTQMLELLDDEDKLQHTQNTMIPNFLDEAVLSLQES